MGKIKIIAVSVIATLLLLVVGFFVIGYYKPKDAGILVDTSPSASVYIDSELVGMTPFELTRDPGEIVVKLVPESFDQPLIPFETKVNLVSGIETIIQRGFAESEMTSSGVIVSFEKAGGDEVSLAVVSIPDASQVSIDKQIRGFTPYKAPSITVGEHLVTVTAEGYQERSLAVRTYGGYKLTAVFKLAKLEEEKEETEKEPEESEEPEEEEKIEIEILSTSTGFLRVRKEASTLTEEVGQVEPGETYLVLEENESAGWYKIEYQEGEKGWVSGEYVKKLEDSEDSSSPSPNPEPDEED